MKFHFNPNLEFQIDAIRAITDLFQGQKKQFFKINPQIIPNILTLSFEEILNNLQKIQKRNGLEPSKTLQFPETPNLQKLLNFTVEMETGTGKTYTYLRTILELHLIYGFSKFIIVVPSIAIREGLLKTLEITKEHFSALYHNLPYRYFSYSSQNLGILRRFAQDSLLQIMVITRDAFNKELNIIHNEHDRLGNKPIELLQKTHPIVILDEPQKMEGIASKWGIHQLNPLFIIRYSATHRNVLNLVYQLTPPEAYNLGLVKKIEVLSLTNDEDPTSRIVKLRRIYSTKRGLRAKLTVFIREHSKTKWKTITVKNQDDLAVICKNDYYQGFVVEEINLQTQLIKFSNGIELSEGQASITDKELVRAMVQQTIIEHFNKKIQLNSKGIKVLSLFFINRVDDYLKPNGWLRGLFESELKKIVRTTFPQFSTLVPHYVHRGYFSRMRSRKGIENDEEAYQLIMKDKERLLSLNEPTEFIFSHSALREGWDNPNIFNICTLVHSHSEIKKRQEIGRGLRLAVNERGERIYNPDINRLTVITNESYRQYIEQLQAEYIKETGFSIRKLPIENKRTKVTLQLKDNLLKDSIFAELWNLLSRKANPIIRFDSLKFIHRCVKKINQITKEELHQRRLYIERILLDDPSHGKIRREKTQSFHLQENTSSFENLLQQLEEKIKLTKSTLLLILKNITNLDLFFKNSEKFLEQVVHAVKYAYWNQAVQNIQYVPLDEKFDFSLFPKQIEKDSQYVLSLQSTKSCYEIKGTSQNALWFKTEWEKRLLQTLDKSPVVQVILRVPNKYKIETPLGNYKPNWLICIDSNHNSNNQRLIFLLDTNNWQKRGKLTVLRRKIVQNFFKAFNYHNIYLFP
ncbi:MAG: restriction endonuclease [Candidatus Helarchaeota archaeon]